MTQTGKSPIRVAGSPGGALSVRECAVHVDHDKGSLNDGVRGDSLTGMATEVAASATPSVELEEMTTIFPYRAWQRREGIQRVEGYYVDDLATLPLQPW